MSRFKGAGGAAFSFPPIAHPVLGCRRALRFVLTREVRWPGSGANVRLTNTLCPRHFGQQIETEAEEPTRKRTGTTGL